MSAWRVALARPLSILTVIVVFVMDVDVDVDVVVGTAQASAGRTESERISERYIVWVCIVGAGPGRRKKWTPEKRRIM